MKTIRFIIVALLCVPFSGALAQPPVTHRWTGECTRNDRTANARLTIDWGNQPQRGTLNSRDISNISYEPRNGVGHIQFSTPGIFQDQNIIRQFRGTFQYSNWSLAGTLSQDDGRVANCSLSYQGR